MAIRFLKRLTNLHPVNHCFQEFNCRYLRGLPYEVARNLETRLKYLQELYREERGEIKLKPVNIGFSLPQVDKQSRKLKSGGYQEPAKANKSYPKKIPLIEVQSEWEKTTGMREKKRIFDHYGIYEDMFGGEAFFYSLVHLQVVYDSCDYFTPVFYGNRVKPAEMSEAPRVNFSSDADSLWTLTATNLDCHFEDPSSEYLLWFVGNIRGNDLGTGDVLCEYMRPFPPKGSGHHRIVFVLYKQEKNIDFSTLRCDDPRSLKARTFKTADFYRKYEDQLTPAGSSFCQCDWDESLTDFFHHELNMREPIFEYDHPPPNVNPQKWNPHKKAFDTYLDMHTPPKVLAEEVLLRRLKGKNPFVKAVRSEFPLVHPIPPHVYVPSWIKKQGRQMALRHGKFRDL